MGEFGEMCRELLVIVLTLSLVFSPLAYGGASSSTSQNRFSEAQLTNLGKELSIAHERLEI
ncbi:MAG: hypothetical protein KDD37_04465, partial [Bdellovibrionales bacterium]|nr:hypothetical protein [Bdellovibrionales bacterium]